MNTTHLEAKATIQILKSPAEVYAAITDPAQMSHYFIEWGDGPIEAGKTVSWKFPEFPDISQIRGEQMEQDKFISFSWGEGEDKMLVEITLEETQEGHTVVRVTEKSRELSDAALEWLRGNTEGWANFLACLKAYLEYGINLRNGAFDFMTNNEK